MFALTGECFIKQVKYREGWAEFSVPYQTKDKDGNMSETIWFNFYVRGEALGYMRAKEITTGQRLKIEAFPNVTNSGKLVWIAKTVELI